MRKQFLLILFLLFSIVGNTARAEEAILNFSSQVEIQPDASYRVTETLRVRAEQNQIRRGIYRDFPVLYQTSWGLNQIRPFEVKKVLRNGITEPYFTESQGSFIRVYIGHPAHILEPGEYEYTLIYQTAAQLQSHEGAYDFYWNITGNQWAFPILQAEMEAIVPQDTRQIDDLKCFTGESGSSESQCRISKDRRKVKVFSNIRLNPGEGMTARFAFQGPKLPVVNPHDSWITLISDNKDSAAAAIGLFVLLIYYLSAWFKAGKDPSGGRIELRFEPPSGFSPSSLGMIQKMGYDSRFFTAALLSLAEKGFVSIEEQGFNYVVIRTEKDSPELPPDEKKLLQTLFREKDEAVHLTRSNRGRILSAERAFKTALLFQNEKTYFIRNRNLFIPGLVLSGITFILTLIFSGANFASGFLVLWLSLWSMGIFVLFRQVGKTWKTAFSASAPLEKVLKLIGAILFSIFALPFLAGEILALYAYFSIMKGPWWVLIFIVGIALLNVIFYRLLKAPTRQGRDLMDQIQGFLMFLKDTASSRPLSSGPEQLPRFFAYAWALGAEKSWAEKFESSVNDSSESSFSQRIHPGWNSLWASSSRSLTEFAGSLYSTIASASASSSSGSGSGGSSGGGGGGGGGGGW